MTTIVVTSIAAVAWGLLLLLIVGLGTCGEDGLEGDEFTDACGDGWGAAEQVLTLEGVTLLVWIGLATYAIRKRSWGALLGGVSVVLMCAMAGFSLVD